MEEWCDEFHTIPMVESHQVIQCMFSLTVERCAFKKMHAGRRDQEAHTDQ